MSSFSSAVLALNPSSYWPFDGASPLADVGSNGFTLTATGSPTRVPSLIPCEQSAADSAYQLSGTGQYLQAGNHYDFSGGIDWTILFWILVESASFGSGFQRVMEKRDTADPFTGWLIYGHTSPAHQLNLDVDGGAASDGFGWAADLATGAAHMIVHTWENSTTTLRAYRDGVPISSENAWTASLAASTAEFTIGATSGGSNALGGRVDDVAVWSGTRISDAQIQNLWSAAHYAFVAPHRVV